MKKIYEEYIDYVGEYGHAVSYETAQYMYDTCKAKKPTKILDMGSGFSSYVFNRYAQEANYLVSVTSVDTSDYWAGVTRVFMYDMDILLPNIISVEELNVPDGSCDFVFHDIASAERRNELMPISAIALKVGGTIVWDDMQHLPHYESALKVSEEYGIVCASLKSVTIDKIGRWAMMGVKK